MIGGYFIANKGTFTRLSGTQEQYARALQLSFNGVNSAYVHVVSLRESGNSRNTTAEIYVILATLLREFTGKLRLGLALAC